MFRNAGIIIHPEREDARQFAQKASAILSKKNIKVREMPGTENAEVPDIILTFGGDGTLLAGAHYAILYQCPLLGFNVGTVGFLTEADPNALERCIDKLLRGDYRLEERSLLTITGSGLQKSFVALNDVVVTRGGYARLIRVESFINNEFHDTITADGIIVATPTGSTGYSLSAGGPVIEPSMNCMVITPVCAHSFRHCPTIVSTSSVIRIRLQPARAQTAELQIDGRNCGTLRNGDEILISGKEKGIRLIRFEDYHFYDLMRQKLTEW